MTGSPISVVISTSSRVRVYFSAFVIKAHLDVQYKVVSKLFNLGRENGCILFKAGLHDSVYFNFVMMRIAFFAICEIFGISFGVIESRVPSVFKIKMVRA